MIANAIPSIVHSPAASPSTPSEKLTTFISPTSQITVSTPPALGNCSAPTNGIVTSVTTAPRLDGDDRRRDLAEQLPLRAQGRRRRSRRRS